MKLVFSSTFIFLCTLVSVAQNGSFLSVSEKTIFLDFSQINDQIQDNYSGLDNYILGFQLGKDYVGDNGVMGYRLSYYFNSSSNNINKTAYRAYSLSSKLERNLLSGKKLKFSLPIEIGLIKHDLKLATKGSKTIEEVLNNNVLSYQISKISPFVEIGLGTRYYFDIASSKFGIGLSAGYHYEFENKWNYDGIVNIANVTSSTNGFYIELNFSTDLFKHGIVKNKNDVEQ